eukprot:109405-Rhodomonas_salina.1
MTPPSEMTPSLDTTPPSEMTALSSPSVSGSTSVGKAGSCHAARVTLSSVSSSLFTLSNWHPKEGPWWRQPFASQKLGTRVQVLLARHYQSCYLH